MHYLNPKPFAVRTCTVRAVERKDSGRNLRIADTAINAGKPFTEEDVLAANLIDHYYAVSKPEGNLNRISEPSPQFFIRRTIFKSPPPPPFFKGGFFFFSFLK